VTVEQVDILPQPVGAYLDAIGSAATAAVFNTARTLVIDAGAWFKKCHFRVTPEIDRALIVKVFLVLGVTLI
jgi:hypothetical protein